jgi:hypothetical protein
MAEKQAAARGGLPAAAVISVLDETIAVNNRPACRLRQIRLLEALHRRGPRPIGEILAAALIRLGPDDRAEIVDLAERIVAWSPDAIRALGASDYPAAPIYEVAA